MMYIQKMSSGLQVRSFAATAKKKVTGKMMVKRQEQAARKSLFSQALASTRKLDLLQLRNKNVKD